MITLDHLILNHKRTEVLFDLITAATWWKSVTPSGLPSTPNIGLVVVILHSYCILSVSLSNLCCDVTDFSSQFVFVNNILITPPAGGAGS